jgi:hypothetical protein
MSLIHLVVLLGVAYKNEPENSKHFNFPIAVQNFLQEWLKLRIWI